MILVFCKYYNDLDQIIPVVHALAESGRKDIELVFLDPSYDLSNDFRVKYLENKFGIKSDYLHNRENAGLWKYFFIRKIIYNWPFLTFFKIFSFCSKIGGSRFHTKADAILRSVPRFILKSIFKKDFAKKTLSKTDISLIISDNRPRPHSLYEAVYHLNIPMVGFPHGLNTSSGEIYFTRDKTNQDKTSEEDSETDVFFHEAFSAFSTQFEREKERLLKKGVPEDKVYVLGSTRYCPEWREVYGDIMPASGLDKKDDTRTNLRVVLMDHSPKYLMLSNEIVDGVKQILNLNYVDLLLKPSTGKTNTILRSGTHQAHKELLDICHVVDDEQSYNLIAWADVVIVTCSSIMLEVLAQGKTFIFPKHFSEWTGNFETLGACWVVDSNEKLISALHTSYEKRGYRPYKENNVDLLFQEMVFGNKKSRQVLDEHVQFLLSFEENKKP